MKSKCLELALILVLIAPAYAGFTDHNGRRWEIPPNGAAVYSHNRAQLVGYLDAERACAAMVIQGRPGRMPTVQEAYEFNEKGRDLLSPAQLIEFNATREQANAGISTRDLLPFVASEPGSTTGQFLSLTGSGGSLRHGEKVSLYGPLAICVADISAPPFKTVAINPSKSAPNEPIVALQLNADSSPTTARSLGATPTEPRKVASGKPKNTEKPVDIKKDKEVYRYTRHIAYASTMLGDSKEKALVSLQNQRAREEPLVREFASAIVFEVVEADEPECSNTQTARRPGFNGENWLCTLNVTYHIESKRNPMRISGNTRMKSLTK